MAITLEIYASKPSARRYLLRSPLAGQAVAFLAQNESLTTSNLAKKMKYAGLGTVNSVLRVLLVAGLVKKLPKRGNQQPYQINWRGVTGFVGYYERQKLLDDPSINQLLNGEYGGAVFRKHLQANFDKVAEQKLNVNLGAIISGAEMGAASEILTKRGQNPLDLIEKKTQ
jgi:hypothetical protein